MSNAHAHHLHTDVADRRIRACCQGDDGVVDLVVRRFRFRSPRSLRRVHAGDADATTQRWSLGGRFPPTTAATPTSPTRVADPGTDLLILSAGDVPATTGDTPQN